MSKMLELIENALEVDTGAMLLFILICVVVVTIKIIKDKISDGE